MKNMRAVLVLIMFIGPGMMGAEGNARLSLVDVLKISLRSSPTLAAARLEADSQLASLQSARKLINPTLDMSWGRGDPLEGSNHVATGGLAVSQELENPFKRNYRLRATESRWLASEQAFREVRQGVVLRIKDTFHTVLMLERQRKLAQENLDSIEEIQGLIRRRAELGEVKELEVLKLEVERLKVRNELNEVGIKLETARLELDAAAGQALPPDFQLIGDLEFHPSSLDENVLIGKALEFHPRILLRREEREEARNRLGLTRWMWLPGLSLSAFSQKEIDGRNSGLGLSIEIPLWDQKTRQVEEARLLVEKKTHELKEAEIQVTNLVRSGYRRLILAEQNLDLYNRGLIRQAEQSLRIAEVSYREGEISLLDYLDSQRTYSAVLRDYNLALLEWHRMRAELERAVGEEEK